jgi:hypothetical protein
MARIQGMTKIASKRKTYRALASSKKEAQSRKTKGIRPTKV